MADLEWLVFDDSPAPSAFMLSLSDPRVRYFHSTDRISVETKRNQLIEQARGEVIALFDDDDYYGAGYLSGMLSVMRSQRAVFVKLFGFFLYSGLHNLFAYWDLRTNDGPHYRVSNGPLSLTKLDQAAFKNNHLGYGFSYVFKKYVWDAIKFPDQGYASDGLFAVAAANRFKLVGVDDIACECLHIIHGTNLSACFPQYLLPRFLLNGLFPKFNQQGYVQQTAGVSVGSAPS